MSVINILQNNGAGNLDQLGLEQFGGEVMSAMLRSTELNGLHTERQLANAINVKFPVLGRVDASYFQQGDEIKGQTTRQTERVIAPDARLVSPIEIDSFDEIFAHFDVRSPYTRKMGQSLALARDAHVLQTAIMAAFDVSEGSEFNNKIASEGATKALVNINDTNATPTADQILGWIKEIALRFDERLIMPGSEKYVLLTPTNFQVLATAFNANGGRFATDHEKTTIENFQPQIIIQDLIIRPSKTLSMITSANYFTTGDVEKKKGLKYAGRGAGSSTGGIGATDPYYDASMPVVKAVGLTDQAVATVNTMGLTLEVDWRTEYQNFLVLARRASGHGVLDPDHAICVYDQT